MSTTITVKILKSRLDKFLVDAIGDISRSHTQRDIEAGLVMVNGAVQKTSKFIVRDGDVIKYTPSVIEDGLLPKNIPLKTLYNNYGLLIIDKPAGLAVHPGAGFKGDNLAQALLYHFKDIHLVGEEGRNGIVHRLDKDTSGVMVVALTPEMYQYLKNAFAERKIKKEYLALVCGRLPQTHGFIRDDLGKSKKDFRKYTTELTDMVLAKTSLTEFNVVKYFSVPKVANGAQQASGALDEYTLVVVKLHTGRMHQIRVHFSSKGFPLVGDLLYGGKLAMKLGITRQFLHSNKIEVRLPDGSWIEAESELPNDLQDLLHTLQEISI